MASSGIVTGSISLNAQWSEYITSGQINPQTLGGFLSAQGLTAPSLPLSFTNGTASLQWDLVHAKPYTLAATTQTVDWTSVTDPGGGSISFARSRLFLVFNPDTVAGHDLKIYAGASNGWAVMGLLANPSWARYGGGFHLLCDPLSTGAGNGNVITSSSKNTVFDSGSNTITFWVIQAGGSAA